VNPKFIDKHKSMFNYVMVFGKNSKAIKLASKEVYDEPEKPKENPSSEVTTIDSFDDLNHRQKYG
jgi:hypothetical protein